MQPSKPRGASQLPTQLEPGNSGAQKGANLATNQATIMCGSSLCGCMHHVASARQAMWLELVA
jgi:hypothetical protein